MFEGLPKINKKLIMSVDKCTEDLDFLLQQMGAICELESFKNKSKNSRRDI